MTQLLLPQTSGASLKVVMQFLGKHRFLSNIHPCSIWLPADGDCPALEFSCLESAYQAAKTLNPETRQRLTELSAKEAKVRAHQASFALRLDYSDDWREETMRTLIEQKFSFQTVETTALAKRLTETQSATLIEGNTWGDTFFGVCLKTGVGQNLLGQALMAHRAKLLEKAITA